MSLHPLIFIAQSCSNLRRGFRLWRRTVKSKMPFVRRREFKRAQVKYDALSEELVASACHAQSARITEVFGPKTRIEGDLCLFLSFQPSTHLKPHVVAHITQLLDNGVRVVLILNALLTADQIVVDSALRERLDGLFVRENIGYDFAGWAHVHSLLAQRIDPERIFLTNDSIVGPLDAAAYTRIIERTRASRADIIGLTETYFPRYHLQSFFLVFNKRAIREALIPFFNRVMCFKDKGTVIDIYETRLTLRLQQDGFVCEALFPSMSRHQIGSNDTYYLWKELIESGFPFIKASVMAENLTHPTVLKLVNERFRGR